MARDVGRDPIRVTITDPETGDVLQETTLDNDWAILVAGNRYVSGVQRHPTTGTVTITIKVGR